LCWGNSRITIDEIYCDGSLEQEVIENHRKGAIKKAVYCYDFKTKEFIVSYESIRGMARDLKMGTISIHRKMDNNKPFKCLYKNKIEYWILYSMRI